MAIDETPSTSSSDSPPVAAIENEFPTYRAISSLSVFSLLLGIGSVFCFADLWFLLVVAGSVLTGWLAIRKIRQFPEILTGTSYARVGVGLGLLFGLTSVTQVVVAEIMVGLDASQFAKHYVDVLKDEPVSLALWYQQLPAYRKTKSADDIAEELKKAKSGPSGDPFGEKTFSIVRMKERLKGKDQTIRFSKVESKVIHGLDVYANALIELDGPGSKEFPEKEQFALLQLFKGPDSGSDDWIVKEVRFPYTPASTVATVEKKGDDDGHGH